MHEMVCRLAVGRELTQDLSNLRLGRVMSVACLCGLGRQPGASLTTLKHFSDDYSAHLN